VDTSLVCLIIKLNHPKGIIDKKNAETHQNTHPQWLGRRFSWANPAGFNFAGRSIQGTVRVGRVPN
jgi:hypothetical protein